MAFKIPSINLLNGKKRICHFCKTDLVFKPNTFKMHKNKGEGTISVTEALLFCPICNRYYISQDISYRITKKHPGYYIDLSTYEIKHKPKSNSKDQPEKQHSNENNHVIQNEAQQTNQGKPQSIASPKQQSQTGFQEKKITTSKDIFFSNSPSTSINSCPICNRSLIMKVVNIPTIDFDKNFYHYYVQSVKYCNNCQKAYITERDANRIAEKISHTADSQGYKSMKLSNGIIRINPSNSNYLFIPYLDNSYSFYAPQQKTNKNETSTSKSMDLSSQSFLGKLGYTVNMTENERRHILDAAVKSFGKRKVTDHLAFLIATRKAQKDGVSKYSHAISIWQDDLNYVFNMQIE